MSVENCCSKLWFPLLIPLCFTVICISLLLSFQNRRKADIILNAFSLSTFVRVTNPHFNDHTIGIHPHPRKPTLHFSLTECFSLSFSDCHESGRKPLESLVKGLNVLSIALKVWSSKGEVSTGWWVACVIPTVLQIWSSDSLQFLVVLRAVNNSQDSDPWLL